MHIFANDIRSLPVNYFMMGVCLIELIVQIVLSEQASTYNFHNQFCMTELLRRIMKNLKKDFTNRKKFFIMCRV